LQVGRRGVGVPCLLGAFGEQRFVAAWQVGLGRVRRLSRKKGRGGGGERWL
jgi:hypothetical protein